MNLVFHHGQGPQHPTKKGVARLTKEDLKHKRNGYGTYTVEQIIAENSEKKKSKREKPRC